MPCPACGSPIGAGAVDCGVCGYDIDTEPRAEKCSRCGSPLGEDFQFCQVCGLAVGLRAPRPQTQRLKVLTTEVRKLRKQSLGERSVPAQGLPTENVIKEAPPRRGPRRGASRAGARGPSPVAPANATPQGPAQHAPSSPASPEAWNTRAVSPVREPPPNSSTDTTDEDRFAGLGASPLRLVLVNRDGSDGESYFFPDSNLTLGRSGSDLVFARDDFLSPVHARLELRADGLWIVDLNSLNGIFVRLTATMPVFPGDTFLIGHQLLRLDNVPDPPAEVDLETQGARLFGTPLDPAWACLTRIGYGGSEAETYFLRSTVVVFGREQGDIVFDDDAFISRQHAQLGITVDTKAMAVSLCDLGSANGTYMRIRGAAKIEVGDMFRIGDQIFRIKTDEPGAGG